LSQHDYETIDPESYLVLAKELAMTSTPAARRTSADRAYYAAFLFSRDQLEAKGYITPYYDIGDHQYVATALKVHIGALGNDENRLRLARNKITYDTRSLPQGGDGVRTLDWMTRTASQIIERVRRLPQNQ
jgi:hypothetical protein